MPTVGLVKGDDRFENVLKALENAGEEVAGKVKGNVIIKVNTVMRAGEGNSQIPSQKQSGPSWNI